MWLVLLPFLLLLLLQSFSFGIVIANVCVDAQVGVNACVGVGV